MKPSALARQRTDEKVRTMTNAAEVYRVAIADLTRAKPGEGFHDAFLRTIDERIAYNRWYRRLWRWIARFPLEES